MTKGKGGGRIFGKVMMAGKDVGKKLIPGQGEVPEVTDPTLSRQQRRLAERLQWKPRGRRA